MKQQINMIVFRIHYFDDIQLSWIKLHIRIFYSEPNSQDSDAVVSVHGRFVGSKNLAKGIMCEKEKKKSSIIYFIFLPCAFQACLGDHQCGVQKKCENECLKVHIFEPRYSCQAREGNPLAP